MAQERTKLIALDNGCYVGEIKRLNDNEIANAKNLKHRKEQKEQETISNIFNLIRELKKKCEELENEIKVLKGEE